MRSIDDSVFDQGFADLTYCGEKARSIIRNPETGLEVELWQDSGFGYVQVYTLPPRASISIEPTSGAADAFNNGIGLTVLGPGKKDQPPTEYVSFIEQKDGSVTCLYLSTRDMIVSSPISS